MDERYFAKVAAIKGIFEIVINRGESNGVKVGMKFLIVGLGDDVIDPDTQESLGKLEIVRGSGKVIHVQEKISTLWSDEFQKSEGTKEIKKVTSTGISSMLLPGGGNTITESITPGPEVQLPFHDVEVGDLIIKK